jgi:mono/diheme cytochrome c family protein
VIVVHLKILRNVFLGYAFLACSAPIVLAEEPVSSDAQGRELYLSYQCWQCHGYEGQGGAAARIASTAYPFDAFARFVRHPDLMPAYPPDLLTDNKLRLIYEYVRSIPVPPLLEDIPELKDD